MGSPLNGPCAAGIACGQGLLCVTVGTEGRCLGLCNLFTGGCPAGQICYTPYASASQLVFEQGQPVGFCFTPQSGLRGPNEPCVQMPAGSNCQRNLECVPQTATTSICRNFCDPSQLSNCGAQDKCHPFSGDYQGHRYGLCYPDNGWGDDCAADAGCESSHICRLMPDPAALNDFALKCQFPVGSAPGLSPCTAGGTCQSGACREDSLYSTANYFCFQHCQGDSECAISGRAGRCDGDFLFSEGNSFGFITGCRPHCASNADCDAYDGGMVCRARLEVTPDVKELRQACSDPLGSAELGEGCTNDTQCRSGFCRAFDWRGVRRQGLCSAPCQGGSDCTFADGGAGLLAFCAVAPYFAANGPDGVPATADDLAFTASLCAEKTCVEDSECASDGGSSCVPSGEATDAGALLRCQRSTVNGGTTLGAAACVTDSQCRSGVCGELLSPSVGRVCLMSCGNGTPCPNGMTCRASGLRVSTRAGPVLLQACVP